MEKMRALVLYLLLAVFFVRLACLILGCFYGPLVYLVVPLGGLCLLLDVMTAYLIYAHADPKLLEAPSDNDRVFRVSWIVANAIGIVGLIVVLGLFLDLGFWSMSYDPVHVALFALILLLLILVGVTLVLLIISLVRGRKSATRGGAEYRGLSY